MRLGDPTLERSERTVDGRRISYLRRGEGPHRVLVLHGFPDHPDSFHSFLKRFHPGEYTLVAPSLRGYPPSEASPERHVFLSDLVGDVTGLAESLGWGSFSVVGHDWGAPIAYAAANARPERIRSLVGMAVPPLGIFVPNVFRHPGQLRRSWYMFLFQLPVAPEYLMRWGNFRLVEWFYENWSPALPNPRKHAERIKGKFRDDDRLRAALAYYRGLLRGLAVNPRKYLESGWLSRKMPDVPTYVLAAENDGCIAPEVFEGTKEALGADGRFDVLPGAGHFMHLERPEELARRVEEFLSKQKA